MLIALAVYVPHVRGHEVSDEKHGQCLVGFSQTMQNQLQQRAQKELVDVLSCLQKMRILLMSQPYSLLHDRNEYSREKVTLQLGSD